MTNAQNLNPGLFRVHRVAYLAYFAFVAMFAAIGVSLLLRGLPDAAIGLVGMGVLPIGALHWFAARGAKLGQRSARNISRVFATLFLLGFPFLTLLGIYMFTQTGKKWQGVT